MLDAFKIGPYDYQSVYDSWPQAPVFTGRVKKDLAVNVWLAAMKEGCKKRKVPKSLWHRVAQNYLRGRAKVRFEDLKKVMRNMHGGHFSWNWKKFKIAMRNMGCRGTNDPNGSTTPDPAPTRQPFLFRTLKNNSGSVVVKSPSKAQPNVQKSAPSKQKPSAPPKASSRSIQIHDSSGFLKSILSMSSATTKTTHVPVWLLDASHSLEVLTSENPKTMCALSAILVALGSVPSVPAVAAGGAGSFLASSTAQAIGTVAIGVGSWLGAPESKK